MRTRLPVLAAVLAFATAAPSPGAGEAVDPLAFLEPFVGAWVPPAGSPMLERHPEMADDVVFLIEWAGPPKKVLRFFEGVPGGDRSLRVLETLVTANPRTGEVLFLGYQTRNDYLYEGSFEPLPDGFVQLYTVTYPPQQEFSDPADAARGAIDYRNVCRLAEADVLECTTEQKRAGEWQPWGSGEPYRLVRSRQ